MLVYDKKTVQCMYMTTKSTNLILLNVREALALRIPKQFLELPLKIWWGGGGVTFALPPEYATVII